MIERIYDDAGGELAIIIRKGHDSDGIEFLTRNDYSQQMAYMHHPQGHIIKPHFHNIVHRDIHYTQEVLVIEAGKLQVDFYDNNKHKIKECIIKTGDIIMLCAGGHGFEVLEEVRMIEIKQGPYVGEADKTKFEPEENNGIYTSK
jgi:mannose-6-phosphate isomerase-like protein (cupin superfamily)